MRKMGWWIGRPNANDRPMERAIAEGKTQQRQHLDRNPLLGLLHWREEQGWLTMKNECSRHGLSGVRDHGARGNETVGGARGKAGWEDAKQEGKPDSRDESPVWYRWVKWKKLTSSLAGMWDGSGETPWA